MAFVVVSAMGNERAEGRLESQRRFNLLFLEGVFSSPLAGPLLSGPAMGFAGSWICFLRPTGRRELLNKSAVVSADQTRRGMGERAGTRR